MPSVPEPNSVELLDVDGSSVTSEEAVSRPSFLSAGWMKIGLVFVLGLGAFLVWGSSSDGTDRADPVEPSASPAGPSGAAAPSGEPSTGAPPNNPEDAVRTIQHRLADVDGRLLVAMASPLGIFVWDLAGGQDSIVPLQESPAGPGLVAVEDRLVYIGSTSAWAVTADGDSRSLGSADLVLATGAPGAVWLGQSVEDESRDSYVDWSEVDQNGNVLRQTRRAMPLVFQTPDLVWGFQSSLYRLTDNADRPWELMTYGLPVAAGQNDLIVKTCQPDCRRLWFDTVSGRDRGPLLADVSASFDGLGGWLSPDGRFLAHQRGLTAPVTVFALGLGAEYQVKCLSAKDVVWSTVGFLACETGAGVDVVDLESGASMSLVPPADLHGFALWLTD